MPEMTIRLERDPATGRHNIVVMLHEDEELLPHEHERLHRQLVDKLVEGGTLQAHELGELIVQRDHEKHPPLPSSPVAPANRKSLEEQE